MTPKLMKNIALTGFMGTGKTEVGKALARKLGYSFVDVDAAIEEKSGLKINDIFSKQGEAAFRDMEAEAIRAASGGDCLIISTGGGAVLRRENMDHLRRKGVVVCLSASPDTILFRTQDSRDRPLLCVEDPLARIRELLAARQPYYEEADIMVDTEGKSPLQIADEIIEEMRVL
jgi:shikimate kinase